jgi:hypothetical protein
MYMVHLRPSTKHFRWTMLLDYEKVGPCSGNCMKLHIMVVQTSGLLYILLGDDKGDVVRLIQRAHAATEPIIITPSGNYVIGHEAQSTKGDDMF